MADCRDVQDCDPDMSCSRVFCVINAFILKVVVFWKQPLSGNKAIRWHQTHLSHEYSPLFIIVINLIFMFSL